MTTTAQTLRMALLLRAELRGAPLDRPEHDTLWGWLTREGGACEPWLAFRAEGRREVYSRAEVARLALRWAHALVTTTRQERPARIGLLLPNGPDFVAGLFAAQSLGASAVPLPWPVIAGAPERLRQSLKPILARAELTALITTPAMAEVDWGVPTLTEANPRATIAPEPDREATAFLQFTSGSTGTPRGAVIGQRAAIASARAMAVALALGPGDIGVSWLPLFHDMGLVGTLLTSLVAGFPVHLMRPGEFLLRPRRWLELVSTERATITAGPNFAWELLTRRVTAEGLELGSLRCALNGSEPVHRATLDNFVTKFRAAGFDPKAMLPVYGLAEATLGVAFSRPEAQRPDLPVGRRAVPCAGSLVPGVELRVVDAADRVVAEGREGELCVRGPTLMNGYFREPDATHAALRDGWLHTGDLGVVQDGVVYVCGRAKELVIQQGRKFHPSDIEQVVATLVDATPNGVAAVTRIDETSGAESLVVVVELRRQSGAIDPMLIRGEVLRQVEVRVDEVLFVAAGTLPRTTSGKIRRVGLARAQPAQAPVRLGQAPAVLVLGAGGFLGLNTVRACLEQGVVPRCGRRTRGNVLGLRGLGAPLVVTDFENPGSLREAMKGIDVVIHAAAHYPRFSLEPARTVQQGLTELSVVLDAAADCGVRRLVFVSSTATVAPRADGRPSNEVDTFSIAPTIGTYHQLKWALEARALDERRLEVVIANPAACVGPFDWKVGTSALLVAAARGLAPPHPAGRISLVDARDVADALVRMATLAHPPRRLILSGETVDAHAMFERLAERYGTPPPPPALDAAAATALSDAEERQAASKGGRARLSRELVDLIVHAPLLDTARACDFGFRPRPLTEIS